MHSSPLSTIPTISIIPSRTPSPANDVCGLDGVDGGHISPPLYSPLNPQRLSGSSLPTDKKGLDPNRFDALLRTSRDRMSSGVARRPTDLRKEVTVKVHHAKQEERRATFLAKLRALPSPTATTSPVTPPDSPAEFHFTLPSPGLVSPLALFETFGDAEDGAKKRMEWVERVHYVKGNDPTQIPHLERVGSAPRASELHAPRYQSLRQLSTSLSLSSRQSGAQRPLAPSLNEITAHIKSSSGIGVETYRAPHRSPAAALPRQPRPTFPAFLLERVKQTEATVKPRPITTPLPRPKSLDVDSMVPRGIQGGGDWDMRAQKGSEMVQRLRKRLSAPAVQTSSGVGGSQIIPGGF